MSLKASAELYRRAKRAFRRLHGYAYRAGEFGHGRFLCGWQQGWLAAKRKYAK